MVHDIREALSFNLAHDDITIYNAVQKLLYIGVACAMILMLASGLAIWKPVQFQLAHLAILRFQGARLVHFLGMSAIVLFLLVHVTLADPRAADDRRDDQGIDPRCRPNPRRLPAAALAYEPAESDPAERRRLPPWHLPMNTPPPMHLPESGPAMPSDRSSARSKAGE